ncbi:MAG: hypothetical protein MPJ50_18720 [Pirellulales bacterium]|nr:hypothetical protein [Pirellulales bacterium]
MSFEPRLVRPSASDAAPVGSALEVTENHRAQGADVRDGDATANLAAANGDAELEASFPQELILLGKQLGREAIRLSHNYPAVPDEQDFQQKLAATQLAHNHRPWFQRIWFRSAAAVMLGVVGLSVLAPSGSQPPSLSTPRGAAVSISGLHVEPPAMAGDSATIGVPYIGVPYVVPFSNVMSSTESLPGTTTLFRGLSGEEIEGLREFERPGTRVSL